MTKQRQPSVPSDGGLPFALTEPPAEASDGPGSARGGAEPVPVPLWEAVGSAVLGAVAVAVFGTALHGHLWYVDVLGAAGVPLPVGAVAALVFAGSLMVLLGSYTRLLWVAAAVGVLAYAMVALAASRTAGNQGIVPFQLVSVLPGPAVAGGLWMFGLVPATLLAVLLVWRSNRQRRTRPAGAVVRS